MAPDGLTKNFEGLASLKNIWLLLINCFQKT